MTKVAIVYHSQGGHTRLQAEAVRRGAAAVEGTQVVFLTAEEASERLEDFDASNAIIFGCPTYNVRQSGRFMRAHEYDGGATPSVEWHQCWVAPAVQFRRGA